MDAKVAKRYVSLAYAEQVVWRSTLCRPCVIGGQCIHCGCESPANMLAATNSCSNGNWGPMWSVEQWDAFKDQYGLSFIIKLNPSTNDTSTETGGDQ